MCSTECPTHCLSASHDLERNKTGVSRVELKKKACSESLSTHMVLVMFTDAARSLFRVPCATQYSESVAKMFRTALSLRATKVRSLISNRASPDGGHLTREPNSSSEKRTANPYGQLFHQQDNTMRSPFLRWESAQVLDSEVQSLEISSPPQKQSRERQHQTADGSVLLTGRCSVTDCALQSNGASLASASEDSISRSRWKAEGVLRSSTSNFDDPCQVALFTIVVSLGTGFPYVRVCLFL